MKRELNLWVLGGDRRQEWLARLLAEDGHRVHTYALPAPAVSVAGLTAEMELEGIERGDCIILPLPVAGRDGVLSAPACSDPVSLGGIFDRIQTSQVTCGGRVDPVTAALAAERGLVIHDYFAREELAVANAVPTAEGCIQIAMEQLPITIHGARVLVIGYGRLGKLTAQRLGALGGRVSVAARRYEQLAWARSQGFGAEQIGYLAGWLCGYDLVVNTVPALVLGEVELADLKPDCLIIDLASKPGGVDWEAARRLGRKTEWALSLPGKVAPATAGEAIKTTIYHILHELGR